ncbi:MAG: hypothetical protein V1913_07465 [Fibrobacterota bacterium]
MVTRPFSAVRLTVLLATSLWAQAGNTITKSDFNFGHQLGYMYSRTDDAYFHARGEGSFETGFLAYYTESMPLVQAPEWRERTLLMVPLRFDICPSDNIIIQAALTDLFVEFPYKNIHNAGGKSPRFMVKMRLCNEGSLRPATAFTCGVKFSSAKPFTIWDKTHNYLESNGLAGADTGVADYLLLFTFSKAIAARQWLHARIGLAPLGSPVEYVRGSGQADELPYGLMLESRLSDRWSLKNEISGMKNGLSSTRLAHYSVARSCATRAFGNTDLTLNLEKGLTRETDEWVVGFYLKFNFGKK